MPDSQPPSSPSQPRSPLPQALPEEPHQSDPQNANPSPNSQNPNQIHLQPSAPETQNPIPQEKQNPSLISLEQHNPDQDQPQILSEDQEQEDPEPDTEGMNLSLSPTHNNSLSDTHCAVESKDNNPPAVTSVRRGGPKRKRGGGKNHRSQAAIEKKFHSLFQNFNPIPFRPGKVLDFDKYEEPLRRLGLWDFAHMEFDKSVRTDLIAKLVVGYNHKNRCSYVNECRVLVSRADLGRALKLPGKKTGDSNSEGYPGEFLLFLEEFVSNYMLLHEDLWCMPDEIVSWKSLYKSGQPERVDWAGLVWYMVEKELAQGTGLKNCYYASHLQHLIKTQKEDLLKETARVELVVEDDAEDCGDVKLLDPKDYVMGGDRMEKQNVQLTPRQDNDVLTEKDGDADGLEKAADGNEAENIGDADGVDKVEDVEKEENVVNESDRVMKLDVDGVTENEEFGFSENDLGVCYTGHMVDVPGVEDVKSVEQVEDAVMTDEQAANAGTKYSNEVNKDMDMIDVGDCRGGEQGQWLLDGRNNGGHHFLQHCTVVNEKVSVENGRPDWMGEAIEDVRGQEDEQVQGFKIMDKAPIQGISSMDLMQSFEQLPYNSAGLGCSSSLDLLSSKTENNMMLHGASMYSHSVKREISPEPDFSLHPSNNNQKRMRVDGPWDHEGASVSMIAAQMDQLTKKIKMANEAEVARAWQQANANQQFLSHQLSEKEAENLELRCTLAETQRRKQAEINRLNRELHLMNSVIVGYRKALKESQRQFAEFRRRYGVHDGPIYRDAGRGGVVKSVMELEREHQKQEEENRRLCSLLEEAYKEQLNDYECKWEEILSAVHSLDDRIANAGMEVELLKEQLVERKNSEGVHYEPANP